jgi:hypothetical protein
MASSESLTSGALDGGALPFHSTQLLLHELHWNLRRTSPDDLRRVLMTNTLAPHFLHLSISTAD